MEKMVLVSYYGISLGVVTGALLHQSVYDFIFSDEMGLGKTITLLSLIVAHQGTELPRIPSPDGLYSVKFIDYI